MVEEPVKSIPSVSSYQVQQIFSPRSSKCASWSEDFDCCKSNAALSLCHRFIPRIMPRHSQATEDILTTLIWFPLLPSSLLLSFTLPLPKCVLSSSSPSPPLDNLLLLILSWKLSYSLAHRFIHPSQKMPLQVKILCTNARREKLRIFL